MFGPMSGAAQPLLRSGRQVEVSRWHAGRVTLVGDAGHAVSLLAGQGASLAMGAAYVLAAELAERGGDVESALGRYETLLKPVIRRKQAAGRRAAEWVAPTKRWRIAMRDTVLRLGRLPGTGRLLKGTLSMDGDSLVPRSAFGGT